jgi:hypothetical protein
LRRARDSFDAFFIEIHEAISWFIKRVEAVESFRFDVGKERIEWRGGVKKFGGVSGVESDIANEGVFAKLLQVEMDGDEAGDGFSAASR